MGYIKYPTFADFNEPIRWKVTIELPGPLLAKLYKTIIIIVRWE